MPQCAKHLVGQMNTCYSCLLEICFFLASNFWCCTNYHLYMTCTVIPMVKHLGFSSVILFAVVFSILVVYVLAY